MVESLTLLSLSLFLSLREIYSHALIHAIINTPTAGTLTHTHMHTRSLPLRHARTHPHAHLNLSSTVKFMLERLQACEGKAWQEETSFTRAVVVVIIRVAAAVAAVAVVVVVVVAAAEEKPAKMRREENISQLNLRHFAKVEFNETWMLFV